MEKEEKIEKPEITVNVKQEVKNEGCLKGYGKGCGTAIAVFLGLSLLIGMCDEACDEEAGASNLKVQSKYVTMCEKAESPAPTERIRNGTNKVKGENK